MLPALAALHALAILAVQRSESHAVAKASAPETWIRAFIQPRIRDAGEPSVDPDLSVPFRLVDLSVPTVHIEQPAIDAYTLRNEAARVAAPTLQPDARTQIASYVQQAALLPGEGATVVLRIEVLESGDPGRIEVDATSGSAQVDQAAVDYARTLHWYAGRMNGVPHATWIRWGVRLQA